MKDRILESQWLPRFRNIVGGSLLLASAFFPGIHAKLASADGPSDLSLITDPEIVRVVKEPHHNYLVVNPNSDTVDQFNDLSGPGLLACQVAIEKPYCLLAIRESNSLETVSFLRYILYKGSSRTEFAPAFVDPNKDVYPEKLTQVSPGVFKLSASVRDRSSYQLTPESWLINTESQREIHSYFISGVQTNRTQP